ncbi:MAG: hypothetical protein J6K25_15945 [Thermoguttaceae bacterium]|nr:hypothetical protein [Thermoguttaceae bacterium]MBP3532647.1 hypothetical protein [Thermoguttaceae bacterium]
MSYRNEMKEEFKGICFILAIVCTVFSVVVTVFAAGIFFVRGCVPTLTAASDKFAERVVESMGEDFEEHSWKIDQKGGGDKDAQDKTSKNNE